MNFLFNNLKISRKGIFDFHVTTASDICMKRVFVNSLSYDALKENYGNTNALVLTTILLNLVCKGLSFYYYCDICSTFYDISNL